MTTAHDSESEGFAPPSIQRPAVWSPGELLLGGIVLLLAIAAAIQGVRAYAHQRACERFGTELLARAEAFQRYMRFHDTPPPDPGEPVLPAGMESYVTAADWLTPTPVGGTYRWIRPPAGQPKGKSRIIGGIAITAFQPGPTLDLTAAELLAIDRQIDDGNLATGNFQRGFNGWPVYWVRSPP